ncbi:hypothetical protein [Sagittula salina]|uniref:Uncharacterized protein n=1 Tax=Sagittula salina TaxID=2820268 RepID=A0A940MUB7_9RHOB|nr:hypothetical protein [Sagittula salina]MBP0483089.1 hypothetical protein [Sagittula salina]
MASTDDQDTDALILLRQAGRERQELGRRLARYEFEALKRDLSDPGAFDLRLEFGDVRPGRLLLDPDLDTAPQTLDALPRLPVPLGRVAWADHPEDLPVTGILIGDLRPPVLASGLLALLTEHHQQPFARLLFLCRTLAPVHVLGRYGFICACIGDAPVDGVGITLGLRHGLHQIRTLDEGALLWSSETAEAPHCQPP